VFDGAQRGFGDWETKKLSYGSSTKLAYDMQNMVIIIIKSTGDTFHQLV